MEVDEFASIVTSSARDSVIFSDALSAVLTYAWYSSRCVAVPCADCGREESRDGARRRRDHGVATHPSPLSVHLPDLVLWRGP